MILPRAELALLMRGSWSQLSGALLLSIGSSALDVVCLMALPAFLLYALAPAPQVVLPGLGAVLPAIPMPVFTAAIAGLFLFRAVYMLIVGAALVRLAESVRERVVTRLVARFVSCPYEVAINRSMAESLTAAVGHSHTFSANVVLPLLRLMLDTLTILVVLGFVALIAPRLVLAIVAVLLLVATLYYVSIRRISDDKSARLSSLEVELAHEVSQTLGAPREVRIFQTSAYFVDRVARTLRAKTGVKTWLGAIYWFPRALGELTLIGLGAAYMIFNAHAGQDAAQMLAGLSALAFAGVRLLPAFAQSLTSLSLMRSGRHTMMLLAADLQRGGVDVPEPPPPAPAGGDAGFSVIELVDVSYTYPTDTRASLSDVRLTLRRGQAVGVVGPSGAGKSTLADVLLGLLAPSHGEVRVDGRALVLPDAAWWSRVGFVPQTPYLANDSLRRNIAFGLPDEQIDAAQVERAVRLARLEDVVARLPQGYDTVLGERGVRLSGGQRQRVAIARALYRGRQLLVLDEATSALDDETQQDVIRAIASLKGEITTFTIAHRTSTLAGCDFIIRLANGRIVDSAS
jgi:ATP-binding cassette subfamily C protein